MTQGFLAMSLTEHTADVWCVPLHLDVLPVPDAIRKPVAESSSLQRLETVFQDLYGINEIDYERRKASTLRPRRSTGATRQVNEFLV